MRKITFVLLLIIMTTNPTKDVLSEQIVLDLIVEIKSKKLPEKMAQWKNKNLSNWFKKHRC
jgi:hypothetical protein